MSKIRTSFVTNSSSTSYIVIGHSDKYENILLNDYDKTLRLGKNGEYEFGWQHEEYDDIWSRINFAFLQSEDIKYHNPEKAKEWLNMLEEVIKEHTEVTSIEWEITGDWNNNELAHGYIDHQSSACEGENTQMFYSKEELKRFLFSPDSYIQCGNDNDYYDSYTSDDN